MKFISWNVNGLRAVMKKNFMQFFKDSNADFFAVQETKMQAGQLEISTPGYFQYFNYAQRKGYSGTAVFTKIKPLKVSYGIALPEFDDEGRVITLEYEKFFFVTCYTPNSQDKLKRIDYRMAWENAFQDYIQKLDQQKPVILCGDLNVAHEAIDLKNDRTNHHNAGFSDQERQKFTNFLNSGFIDSFRYLHPNQVTYSWWSYRFNARQNNAGWRIDYFVLSERLQKALISSTILTEVMGSDHAPIELKLDIEE